MRLSFLLVGVVASAACTPVVNTEEAAARPVRVEAAQAAPAPAAIRYSATIEAFRQLPLAFKASGYVDYVAQRPGADRRARAAQAGDRVTAGTVLASVKDADYRDRVAQGRARLAEAQAGLAKAQADLTRARTLFAADSLTRPDLDAAQAAFDSGSARVAGAQADVDLAQSALKDVALVAPATGVLLDRRVEVGTLVSTGSVGFTLLDVSSVKARFGIPDAMLAAVTLGAPIGVTVDAVTGETFPGRVTALAPAADPQSRVFDVEISIPNLDGRLRPGMIGAVSFAPSAAATTEAARVPIVPLNAVVKPQGGSAAYAVLVVEGGGTPGVARLRPVELGDVVGNGVTVRSGLALGERVVVTGAGLLSDGDAVRVIP